MYTHIHTHAHALIALGLKWFSSVTVATSGEGCPVSAESPGLGRATASRGRRLNTRAAARRVSVCVVGEAEVSRHDFL